MKKNAGRTATSPEQPKPLPNPSDYDEKVVKERLQYVHDTLHSTPRQVSPIGVRALRPYQNACAHLLDLLENPKSEKRFENIKNEWIAAIMSYEKSTKYEASRNPTRADDEQKMQDSS